MNRERGDDKGSVEVKMSLSATLCVDKIGKLEQQVAEVEGEKVVCLANLRYK